MNQLQPRKVEVGALRRWLSEAIELTRRHIFVWLLATALFSLLCTITALFQILFVGIVTGAAAAILGVSFGVLIAAHTDKRISGKALRRALLGTQNWRYTGRTTLEFIRRSPVFVLACVGTSLIFSRFPAPVNVSEATLPLMLWPLTFTPFVLFVYLGAINTHPQTDIHRFLATTLLGISWAASEVLVLQGYSLNLEVLTKLNLARNPLSILAVLVVAGLTFTPFGDTILALVGVVLFPLVSSLLYVSFRDIYLGVAENSPAKVPERQGAPALASES